MSKKKILFVVQHLTVGGVQKSLVSALGAINYDKYDVTLYVRKNRLDIADYIDKHVNIVANTIEKHYYREILAIALQFKIFALKLLNRRQECQRAKKQLSDYIVKKMMEDESEKYFKYEKYDIAISYVQSITAMFVNNYVKADKRIVFYQGSTDEYHDINATMLPKFDKVVVEHNDIKKLLLKWYDDLKLEQIIVLANYTDSEFLKRQSAEIKKENNKTILCTCARFSSVKGIDLAVESAKILKNKGYNYLWYMVGDGPEMDNIKSLTDKYDLSDCIKLTGMQKNPYPYMSACDIYVQPSREEALSIAMLESQILCAPMISTKTAGGLAMIQNGVNGLLADINPQSLADEIEKLITNDDLRNRIKHNLSSIDYTAEKERYKSDWENLLEK